MEAARVFKESRGRMVFVVLGSAVFVGGCIWILSTHRSAADWAIGGVGILFFGACGISGVKRLTLPAKFLQLNAAGLKSDAFPGFADEVSIAWTDVVSVSTFTINNIANVVIQTADYTAALETMPLPSKLIAQANIGLCGSPYVLCAMNFAVSHSELLHSIQNAWQESQKGQA